MIEIDPSRWKTQAAKHQIEGVRFCVARKYAAILDEMGSGKTKQMVDTLGCLYEADQVDTVVVVAPSAVKHSWKNLRFGEIVKHGWVPGWVGEYFTYNDSLMDYGSNTRSRLYWIITGYEFIRNEPRLLNLIKALKGRKVAIIADEGSFIKSHKALQTRSIIQLRAYCDRAYLLNGSPIANNALDLYSQMEFLSRSIIGCQNYYHARNKYCILGPYNKIVGYKSIDKMLARIQPHVLRRLKEDCLDLPPKMYKQEEIPMSEETWRIYKQMRDRMVVVIKGLGTSMTLHGVVKVMRLAQLTAGFLGGFEDEEVGTVHEIHREKLDAFLEWYKVKVEEDPNFRLVLFCRFTPERERVARDLRGLGKVVQIYGGQRDSEREAAIEEFTVGTTTGPVTLVAQSQAGGFGLNLITAHNAVYLSNDYSLLTRQQSEDRLHRRGQVSKVLYTDFLMCGPQGQRTFDHVVYAALSNKQDFAKWASGQLIEKLMDESPFDPRELAF